MTRIKSDCATSLLVGSKYLLVIDSNFLKYMPNPLPLHNAFIGSLPFLFAYLSYCGNFDYCLF